MTDSSGNDNGGPHSLKNKGDAPEPTTEEGKKRQASLDFGSGEKRDDAPRAWGRDLENTKKTDAKEEVEPGPAAEDEQAPELSAESSPISADDEKQADSPAENTTEEPSPEPIDDSVGDSEDISDDDQDATEDDPPPKRSRKKLLLTATLIITVVGLFVSVGLAGYLYWYFQKDLPELNRVTDYHPNLITNIYSVDAQNNEAELVAEYYLERRKIVEIEKTPDLLKKAFVAAEDSSFYQHQGIDFAAIFRAAIANLKAGGFVQGGSTITQQVTKSLLLSTEKKLSRKIREAILAIRIEKKLTKDEILWLYLNQIYLGHGAYGVLAAAENYYAKDVSELTLGEMAILAGLPKAPGRDSPKLHFERAKKRQIYVLGRMVTEGFITEKMRAEAEAEEIVIRRLPDPPPAAAWYTENVRRYIQDKYGDKMLYQEGLKVITAMRLDLQIEAQESVTAGLRALDKRQGYRGPLQNIFAKDDSDEVIDEKIATFRDKQQAELQQEFEGEIFDAEHPLPGIEPSAPPDKIALKAGRIYEALVLQVDSTNDRVKAAIGALEGLIPLRLMSWAREPNPEVAPEWDPVRDPAKVLKKGDVVLVRPVITAEGENDFSELDEDQTKYAKKAVADDLAVLALDQHPIVEAAVYSMDAKTGNVRAMVGGVDPIKSEFNRAVQAKRQPGSAFKPIIYTAALDKGYTPASIIIDSPILGDLDGEEDKWKPKNYGGEFMGPVTFHKALTESRNLVSIKILRDIGISYAIDYARRFGVEEELAPDLSLALGSTALTLETMVRVFSVFPRLGVRPPQIYVRQIFDRNGVLIEDNRTPEEILGEVTEKLDADPGAPVNIIIGDQPYTVQGKKGLPDLKRRLEEWSLERGVDRAISPQTAYIMTTVLQDVVRVGTGWRVKALGRPAAGKTGTTNDGIDTWFVGFTPDIVTGVWVGSDQMTPLGKNETGGKTAIPIWLDYMTRATAGMPITQFEKPDGIEYAHIDYDNGLLATPGTMHPVRLAFKSGSAPSVSSAEESSTAEEGFFRLDMGL